MASGAGSLAEEVEALGDVVTLAALFICFISNLARTLLVCRRRLRLPLVPIQSQDLRLLFIRQVHVIRILAILIKHDLQRLEWIVQVLLALSATCLLFIIFKAIDDVRLHHFAVHLDHIHIFNDLNLWYLALLLELSVFILSFVRHRFTSLSV